MFRSPDADDTVRLRPAPRRTGLPAWLSLSGIGVLALAIPLWLALRPPFRVATEAEIFRHAASRFTVFRLRNDPEILVVDCPGLHAQGLMFDRIAALIEKAGAPRNHVLSESGLAATLLAARASIGTYYYGNDYPARALRRFFRLARAEHIPLNRQERLLRRIASRAGFLRPGAEGAVLSLPASGPGHRVSLHARAVILRHELSHGAFFTIASYRAFVRAFWNGVLTAPERAAFRAFLARQGYDPSDGTLIINETQAYLVFTPDPDFFRASAVGLPRARIAALRRRFIAAMPDFWLKRLATAKLPSG